MKKHKIRESDCIYSLAMTYGFSPEALWNHKENSELAQSRAHPCVLATGDIVVIPDRKPLVVDVPAGGTYTFVLVSTHVDVNARLVVADEPLADEPYEMTVNGTTLKGVTDGDGVLSETIEATVNSVTVLLTGRDEELVLTVGALEPGELPKGARQRLQNLGYEVSNGGLEDPAPIARAVWDFQVAEGLEPTGELDHATVAKIADRHGA